MIWFLGKPIPWLSWWKNDVLLDNTSVLTPQGVVRNELVITRLDRNDDRSILSCKASNSNQTKPVTSFITLELNRKSYNHLTLFCANIRVKNAGQRKNYDFNDDKND